MRSVRRVTCGLARLNVIVIFLWRVVVSIHLVSLLIKHRIPGNGGNSGSHVDGIDV